MTNVYVITEGEYSDEDIIAVASTFDLAKEAVRLHIEQRIAKQSDFPPEARYAPKPYSDRWQPYPANNHRAYRYWEYSDNMVAAYRISELVLDAPPMPPA